MIVVYGLGYNCYVVIYATVLYFRASSTSDAGGSRLEICKLAIMASKVSVCIDHCRFGDNINYI